MPRYSKQAHRLRTDETVREVATRMCCHLKDARRILEILSDVIVTHAAQGEVVTFAALGAWTMKESGRPRMDGTRRPILKFRPSRRMAMKLEEMADGQK